MHLNAECILTPPYPSTLRQVRAKRVESQIPLNPVTAGIYIATMMAQVIGRWAGGRFGMRVGVWLRV